MHAMTHSTHTANLGVAHLRPGLHDHVSLECLVNVRLRCIDKRESRQTLLGKGEGGFR